jgi:hypothetical protein
VSPAEQRVRDLVDKYCYLVRTSQTLNPSELLLLVGKLSACAGVGAASRLLLPASLKAGTSTCSPQAGDCDGLPPMCASTPRACNCVQDVRTSSEPCCCHAAVLLRPQAPTAACLGATSTRVRRCLTTTATGAMWWPCWGSAKTRWVCWGFLCVCGGKDSRKGANNLLVPACMTFSSLLLAQLSATVPSTATHKHRSPTSWRVLSSTSAPGPSFRQSSVRCRPN